MVVFSVEVLSSSICGLLQCVPYAYHKPVKQLLHECGPDFHGGVQRRKDAPAAGLLDVILRHTHV